MIMMKKEKNPWEDIPLEIIIEDKRQKKEIEDSWRRQPSVYDILPEAPRYRKEEKKEKKTERGVAIIRMY